MENVKVGDIIVRRRHGVASIHTINYFSTSPFSYYRPQFFCQSHGNFIVVRLIFILTEGEAFNHEF